MLYSKDLLEGASTGTRAGPLLAGTLVAFVVGVLSLKWLLRIVAQQKLAWFAAYCAIVGLATIVWQTLG
ncbi:MAG: undecaprenyl-diphosphate phosphatase [Planctomycetaceae bacterium]